MSKQFILFIAAIIGSIQAALAQLPIVHSHNDYHQAAPFFAAYVAGAKSIEVDVFYKDNNLFVAHERNEISAQRTFENLYVKPLLQLIKQGTAIHTISYLVDIKTDAIPAMKKLVEICAKYPNVFSANGGVKLYISGNRPTQQSYTTYPAYIYFDGRNPDEKTTDGGNRIGLISRNITDFTQWRGEGKLPEADSLALQNFIAACHAAKLPVRFWNTPDNTAVYKALIALKVDYLNTDNPFDAVWFLSTLNK